MVDIDSPRRRVGAVAAGVLAATTFIGGTANAQTSEGVYCDPPITGLYEPGVDPRTDCWTDQEEISRRESISSSDIPRLENIVTNLFKDSALPPNTISRLESLGNASNEEVARHFAAFQQDEETFLNNGERIETHTRHHYQMLPNEGEEGMLYPTAFVNLWAQDIRDSNGNVWLSATVWVNEEGQFVTGREGGGLNTEALYETASNILKVPVGEIKTDEDGYTYAEAEDENYVYWVNVSPSDGGISVDMRERDFHYPRLAYGPNHPAPDS